MLINLLDEGAGNQLSNSDFCIIGTGIAGYEVARILSANPANRIVMLEAGNLTLTAANQALALQVESGKTTRIRNYNPYRPEANISRARQLGGTLHIWSGRWKPLEHWDFEPKSWNNLLRWPISYQDVLPHYQSVINEYQLPEQSGCWQEADVSDLKFTPFYHSQTPLRLTDRLMELSGKPNVNIVFNAPVSHLVTDEAGSIKEVFITAANAKKYTVSATCFILATGGIENARVLLNTKRLSEALPALGRYYMDHPKAELVSVVPYVSFMHQHYANCSTPNAGIKKMFGLTNDVLNQHHLPNHTAFAYPSDENAVNGMHPFKKRYIQASSVIKNLLVKLINHPLRITFHLEQLPSFNSQVLLANQTDALGCRKAELNWTFTSQEQEKLLQYLLILKEKLLKIYGCTLLVKEENINLFATNDASHHIGTTRMGISRRDSVVDEHCKVHGTHNLYVAGSSVFCTAGNANPTLTIAALSARLGKHLTETF